MIHTIHHTALALSGDPLPFEIENKAHIDVFWEQAFEANPRLWNGPFFMFSEAAIVDGVLCAQAHKTDFATFLYWRENGRSKSATHITATSFPVLSDGSLLAVRMSKHTANAGRVYFPAGAFDRADNFGGHFDPMISLSREMEEEVGVELETSWFVDPMLCVSIDNAYYMTRKTHLPMDFSTVEKLWQRHRKNGGDDEIDGLVQISSARQICDAMPAYARALCDYHFAQGE